MEQSGLIEKILYTDYLDNNAGISEFEHIRESPRAFMEYERHDEGPVRAAGNPVHG